MALHSPGVPALSAPADPGATQSLEMGARLVNRPPREKPVALRMESGVAVGRRGVEIEERPGTPHQRGHTYARALRRLHAWLGGAPLALMPARTEGAATGGLHCAW